MNLNDQPLYARLYRRARRGVRHAPWCCENCGMAAHATLDGHLAAFKALKRGDKLGVARSLVEIEEFLGALAGYSVLRAPEVTVNHVGVA